MARETERGQPIIAEDLTYPAGDGFPIEAHLARPDRAGRAPAVIVLHARNGLLPFFKECADELAGEGFVGFALGWQTRLPPNDERRLPPDSIVLKDIQSAIGHLKAQPFVEPDQIGIMGFCRGGNFVFLSASLLDGIRSAVAHYGAPRKFAEEAADSDPEPVPQAHDVADRMSASLLIIQGDQDPAIPLEHVHSYRDKLLGLGKSVSLEVYPGMGHAFTIRGGRSYEEEPARDAWEKTVAHFKSTLAGE